MNIYKKSLQDEKRIKRWSICCWVSAGISWFIQQKYIQWIYQNLGYTKFGREFSIVFVFIVVFPCLLNLLLWPSQYYSEKELRENIYNTISAGGIQEIESIRVYKGKYFVKMRFYGEGYFTLEGTHVDIVSVGHVINMKNG